VRLEVCSGNNFIAFGVHVLVELVDTVERARDRVPSLVLPLTLAGAGCGWLTGAALGGPLLGRIAPSFVAPAAAPIAAGAGLVVGWLLRHVCRQQLGSDRTKKAYVPAVAVVVGMGGVAGAVVDAVLPYSEGWPTSAVVGALAAMCSLPIVIYVMSAARRAARARHGSLVAATDRRAVWVALALAMTVATLVALPEWQEYVPELDRFPFIAFWMALAGATVAMAALTGDALAMRRLRELTATVADMRSVEAEAAESVAGRVHTRDLGLGRQARAAFDERASYRHRPGIVALVTGDVDEAERAIAGSIKRAAASVLVALLVIALHLLTAPYGAIL
jgi:hypothetical protein